jgi:hypothetical protein
MILAYKNKKKIRAFAEGCGAVWASADDIQTNTLYPMIFSGVTTTLAKDQALRHNLDYWYIDTGYFGNGKRKTYLRVTKNAYHNWYPIMDRPRDRLNELNLDLTPFQRGNRIMIVPPDHKVCDTHNLGDPEHWIQNIISIIQQHTDREIMVRRRPESRTDRLVDDTFLNQLQQDINVVVTYTSNCAVESVMHDIPVISLGKSATVQICPGTIDQIDCVPDIDPELKESWLRHLSYSQFTEEQMRCGTAWDILNK